MEFSDTLVYKDHNNRLQTTLYKKQLTAKIILMQNLHILFH